jgi:hypothetical protein
MQHQQDDMGYGSYTQPLPQAHPEHLQQQQHHSGHQPQHYPQQQVGMMDPGGMGEYYGYNNYQTSGTQMAPSAALNEIDYSWHNLVAQYRP